MLGFFRFGLQLIMGAAGLAMMAAGVVFTLTMGALVGLLGVVGSIALFVTLFIVELFSKEKPPKDQ